MNETARKAFGNIGYYVKVKMMTVKTMTHDDEYGLLISLLDPLSVSPSCSGIVIIDAVSCLSLIHI